MVARVSSAGPRTDAVTKDNKGIGALRFPCAHYILETPSIIVDSKNVAAYRSESTWTEPVEGKPEVDNGKPTGEPAP